MARHAPDPADDPGWGPHIRALGIGLGIAIIVVVVLMS